LAMVVCRPWMRACFSTSLWISQDEGAIREYHGQTVWLLWQS